MARTLKCDRCGRDFEDVSGTGQHDIHRVPHLGPQREVRTNLQKWLMLQAWKKASGPNHWIARPPSKRINVEVIGNPVQQVSIMVPIARGAGNIVGQFVNSFASSEARLWVAEVLGEYGDRVTEPIDRTETFGERRIRVQSLGATLVLTVSATVAT